VKIGGLKMSKKICIIEGHCLAINFYNLLKKHKSFVKEYKIVPYFITENKYINTVPSNKEMENCDLLIYQRAALLNENIQKINGQKIAYPYPTFNCLWPYQRKSSIGEYNYRLGSDITNIIYDNLDFDNQTIIKKVHEIQFDEQVLNYIYKTDIERINYIDSFCDIKLSNIFTDFTAQYCFNTYNHLSIQYKLDLLQNILEYIGFKKLSKNIVNDFIMKPQWMTPIHPKIIQYFGLSYVNNDFLYWCFHHDTDFFGWFTFNGFINNYIDDIRKRKLSSEVYNNIIKKEEK